MSAEGLAVQGVANAGTCVDACFDSTSVAGEAQSREDGCLALLDAADAAEGRLCCVVKRLSVQTLGLLGELVGDFR